MYKVISVIGLCLIFIGTAFGAQPSRNLQPIDVWVPDTFADPGATISIPIMTGDVTGHDVISYQATITYRGDLLTATGATVGSIVPSGWLITDTSSYGQIVIAMAGATALSGSGDLCWIQFTVAGNAALGDTTTIHFVQCMYNEGEPPTNPIDGLFTVGQPPPPQNHDVGVTEILAPIGQIIEGTDVTPKAVVHNFGEQDETFQVVFNIDQTGTADNSNPNVVVYADTLHDIFVPIGGTDTIDFDSWHADLGAYNTISYTILANDTNFSNDTTYGSFEVVPETILPIDVWLPDTTHIAPGDRAIIPIRVSNVTGRGVISCDIELTWDADWLSADSTYLGSVVPPGWLLQSSYPTRQVIIAMAGANSLSDSGDLLWIRFVVSENAQPCHTTIVNFARCSFNEGLVPTDPIAGVIHVAVGPPRHDVGVDTILAPIDTIFEGTVVTPSVIVKNFGDTTETFPVKFEFNSYSSTRTVTDLAPGATTTVEFDTITPSLGSYSTISYTILVGDENPANDTQSGWFVVIESVPPPPPVDVWLPPSTTGNPGDAIWVPMMISDVTGRGVIACDFELAWDAPWLSADSVRLGPVVPPGWLLVPGFPPEAVIIAMAGADPLVGSGVLLEIRFIVSPSASDSTFIDFARCALNEGLVPCNCTGGWLVVIPETVKHDVGVTAILAPVGTIIEDTVVTPTSVVENFGTETETFWVKFDFTGYLDSVELTLVSGAVDTVEFTPWTAVVGTYSPMSYTMLVGDEIPSNDTVYLPFGLLVIPSEFHDVGVTEILAPVGTITEGTVVTPSAEVKNFGNQTETFYLVFKIDDIPISPSPVTITNLAPGATSVVSFDPWPALVVGTHTTMAYTILVGDTNPHNDTMYGSFVVESIPRGHDVGVIEILEPVGTIYAGTVVTPKAVVQNFGIFTETFSCYFTIGCAYFDWKIMTLSYGCTGICDTVVFAPWTAEAGYYNEAAETDLENDQNDANDRILLWLTVVSPPPTNPQGYTVDAPLSFAISTPYPNPAQNNFSIRFAVPRTSKVEIAIYDINGVKVKSLLSETREPGFHNVTTNCKDLPNGAYIVKMNADNYRAIEKFIVTK